MMLGTCLRNELWKLFARKRTYIGFGVFLLVEMVILGLLTLPKPMRKYEALLRNNGLPLEEYSTGLTMAAFTIFFTVALMGTLYLALVSGDMVAKEVEDGTIRMVLARPVARGEIILAKILASAIHTFLLMLFIGATSLLAAALCFGGLGKLLVFGRTEGVFAVYEPAEGLWRYVRAIGFLGLSYQVVSAMAMMFSCFKMKPAAATVLTLSVVFADFVLRNIPQFAVYDDRFLTHHLSCWILTFQYVVPRAEIAESLLLIGGLSVSFWIIGGAYFCVRDFKP